LLNNPILNLFKNQNNMNNNLGLLLLPHLLKLPAMEKPKINVDNKQMTDDVRKFYKIKSKKTEFLLFQER